MKSNAGNPPWDFLDAIARWIGPELLVVDRAWRSYQTALEAQLRCFDVLRIPSDTETEFGPHRLRRSSAVFHPFWPSLFLHIASYRNPSQSTFLISIYINYLNCFHLTYLNCFLKKIWLLMLLLCYRTKNLRYCNCDWPCDTRTWCKMSTGRSSFRSISAKGSIHVIQYR